MNLRTYRADTMANALSKVKKDLGNKAVILSTRTVKTGGWFGLGTRTSVEITAGDDTNVLPARRRPDRIKPASVASNHMPEEPAVSVAAPTASHSIQSPAISQELQDIKSLVKDLVKQNDQTQLSKLPVELRQAYVKLLQNQVAEELAAQIVKCIESKHSQTGVTPSQINELLTEQISQIIKPGCPIKIGLGDKCNVIALIGPTGVGKTTTVAKLAAHFRLKEKKTVGLITIDTYRIAAVEQLRTYAKIIDVPLEVALTPDELRAAIKRLQSCDVVFLDTAGRSQFDQLKLNELKQFIDVAKPHETHLVLSSNCNEAVLMNAVDRFSNLGVNRVIFTKLDESVGIGTLLNVMERVDAQLSYVTTGQDVPNDIQVGDNRVIAQMIMEGRAVHN